MTCPIIPGISQRREPDFPWELSLTPLKVSIFNCYLRGKCCPDSWKSTAGTRSRAEQKFQIPEGFFFPFLKMDLSFKSGGLSGGKNSICGDCFYIMFNKKD